MTNKQTTPPAPDASESTAPTADSPELEPVGPVAADTSDETADDPVEIATESSEGEDEAVADETTETEVGETTETEVGETPQEATAETETTSESEEAVEVAVGGTDESPKEPSAKQGDEEQQELAKEPEKVQALRSARESHDVVEGKIIGWNNGGFHVVVGDVTAFCPRSEIEIGAPHPPESYLDKELTFHVLNVQKKGKRVVLSRASVLRGERTQARQEMKERLAQGKVITGRVASLTDFGAFVDLGGGIHGLVHVSEIRHSRVEKPSEVLEVGQEVEVKVLKLEKGGKRISLSMKALEPDPWRDIRSRFPEGSIVTGTVEKATPIGAFIQLEPGLTGLLPTSAMSIPREASPARVYPAGKEVKVQIMGVDSRRQRISLALEGSTSGGTRGDYQTYVKQQRKETGQGGGFNALADALKKLH